MKLDEWAIKRFREYPCLEYNGISAGKGSYEEFLNSIAFHSGFNPEKIKRAKTNFTSCIVKYSRNIKPYVRYSAMKRWSKHLTHKSYLLHNLSMEERFEIAIRIFGNERKSIPHCGYRKIVLHDIPKGIGYKRLIKTLWDRMKLDYIPKNVILFPLYY